jgi:hypothetical protein
MDSKEPSDDLQQTSVNLANHKHSSLQAIPNYPASDSRPFLQESAARECTDQLSNFDKMAKVDQCDTLAPATEPMRKKIPADCSRPPRRFYRTFWRSLTFRLTASKARSQKKEWQTSSISTLTASDSAEHAERGGGHLVSHVEKYCYEDGAVRSVLLSRANLVIPLNVVLCLHRNSHNGILESTRKNQEPISLTQEQNN